MTELENITNTLDEKQAETEHTEQTVSANGENEISSQLEIKIEDIDYLEFKRLLSSYYDGLSKLIRITKTKDETIAKLTKEIQAYREGFISKLVKPISLSLINLREDYRKTQRELDSYAKTSKDVIRYCDYILSDIEELLSEQDVIINDNEFYINDVSLFDRVPRKVCYDPATISTYNGSADSTDNKPEFPQSFDGILSFISYKNEEIKAVLSANQVLDNNLNLYADIVSSIDDNYSDAILLPIYKAIAESYLSIKEYIMQVRQEITEDNKTEEYDSVLKLVLEKLDNVFLVAGVSVREDITDEYDMSSSRILRVIPTDEPSLDQKVAKRHTDCYVLEEKIIYPFKVDVYKFRNN